eukprot:6177170-Pleurochrysis_carterae.AAC.1
MPHISRVCALCVGLVNDCACLPASLQLLRSLHSIVPAQVVGTGSTLHAEQAVSINNTLIEIPGLLADLCSKGDALLPLSESATLDKLLLPASSRNWVCKDKELDGKDWPLVLPFPNVSQRECNFSNCF